MTPLSVSEAAQQVRGVVDSDPRLQGLAIRGEAADVKTYPSGHTYFSVRDPGATLRCVLFRGNATRSERFASGEQIDLFGDVNFYAQSGQLQVIAKLVRRAGRGESALLLEMLRLKLEEEGLFDPARKRPLPVFPRRIGVVTSPAGAVWHDIQNVVRRRYPLAELVLSPTSVQGERAPAEIRAAFDRLNRIADLDVVILARGGGSSEDLMAFNDESVARAIHGCRFPTVSAVGHETDTTIADMVADRRAPTPSAAAELCTPDGDELLRSVRAAAQRLDEGLRTSFEQRTVLLGTTRMRLSRAQPEIRGLRAQTAALAARLRGPATAAIAAGAQQLAGSRGSLGALSPRLTLERGFAVVERAGSVLRSAAQANVGDALTIRLADGSLEAVATRTEAA